MADSNSSSSSSNNNNNNNNNNSCQNYGCYVLLTYILV